MVPAMTRDPFITNSASADLLEAPAASAAGPAATPPRSDAFARTAAVSAIASAPSALACLVVAMIAAGFDPAAMSDPAAVITRGAEAADLFFWSMILDMFGYYLLLAPVALYLWYWHSRRAPGLVTLYTAAGLAYVLIGSIGAVLLAAAVRPLSRAYVLASGPEQEMIRIAFETVTHIVYGGLWSILELLLAGVWWLGMGWLLRGERPLLAGLSMLLGTAALVNAAGTMLGADVIARGGLFTYLYSAPLWALWLGIAIARGAGAREVRVIEERIAARGVRPLALGIGLIALLLGPSHGVAQQHSPDVADATPSHATPGHATPSHAAGPALPALPALRAPTFPTAPAHGSVVQLATAATRPAAVGLSGIEQDGGSRLSLGGAVGGALLGAAVGTLVACHFNRDSYGIYCLGQSDTKLAIGAVLGGAAGGILGAHLLRRRR
jgi:hypothetical protein